MRLEEFSPGENKKQVSNKQIYFCNGTAAKFISTVRHRQGNEWLHAVLRTTIRVGTAQKNPVGGNRHWHPDSERPELHGRLRGGELPHRGIADGLAGLL